MPFLVKEEPENYSFDTFLKDNGTTWSGVRNPLAQKHRRSHRKIARRRPRATQEAAATGHAGRSQGRPALRRFSADLYAAAVGDACDRGAVDDDSGHGREEITSKFKLQTSNGGGVPSAYHLQFLSSKFELLSLKFQYQSTKRGEGERQAVRAAVDGNMFVANAEASVPCVMRHR